MEPKRIVVLGDRCVDLYWVGAVSGISAEAPVPVVKQSAVVALPGMAANVAKLLGDLGGVEVQFLTPAEDHLPVKNRLVTEDGTQLARWDFEDWCAAYQNGDTLIPYGGADAVVISDYSKGSVDAKLVKELRTYSESGTPLFIDTKNDPFLWAGLENVILFPNAKEYLQYQDHYDWMPSVVWKRGALGMTYMEYGEEKFSCRAEATQVRNVCGAGDAVIAAWTSAAVRGSLPEDSLRIASQAAGAYVERPWNDRRLTSVVLGACR